MRNHSSVLPTGSTRDGQDGPAVSPGREGLTRRLEQLGLADRLTISIPEAGRLLGLGYTASYKAAAQGDIPYRLIGKKKKRVFVDALLAMAELTEEQRTSARRKAMVVG